MLPSAFLGILIKSSSGIYEVAKYQPNKNGFSIYFPTGEKVANNRQYVGKNR